MAAAGMGEGCEVFCFYEVSAPKGNQKASEKQVVLEDRCGSAIGGLRRKEGGIREGLRGKKKKEKYRARMDTQEIL